MALVSALLVRDDGSAEITPIDPGAIHELIEGALEVHAPLGSVAGEWRAFSSAEGDAFDLDLNLEATLLATRFGWPNDTVLRGLVVFVGCGPDGESIDVPPEVVADAAQFLTFD